MLSMQSPFCLSIEGADFIALMSPTDAQRRRLQDGSDAPKWFAYPLLQCGCKLHFSRSFRQIQEVLKGRSRSKPLLLVFTLSLFDFCTALGLQRHCRVITLYQWRPLERLAPLKRLTYWLVLRASHKILVYSKLAQTYLSSKFPGKRIQWIGLYTDTDYFSPEQVREPPLVETPYLLVPGNHKRDEGQLVRVAGELKTQIVRCASDPRVRTFHLNQPSRFVRVLTGIPFSQVRNLYHYSAGVLNMVEDGEWPVGITTFCEALSMNSRIATPAGHSASGYCFEDRTKPYLIVADSSRLTRWYEAARELLAQHPVWRGTMSPRALALNLCSVRPCAAAWSKACQP